MSTTASPRSSWSFPILSLALPLACLVWAYWPTLADLVLTWHTQPQYSHGYLVPVFALFLLWSRRAMLAGADFRPSWLGLPLLLAGIGMRLGGAFYWYDWLDKISLIPCLAGVWLLVGGRASWRWAWPALLFLTFMVPLPYRYAIGMSGPLQRLATVSSTFVMQVLGLPALAEGNVILLNDASIGIVEACSGLRMLMVFFALSTAMALVIERPLLDRLILVVSAIPIALIANIIRVTVTGILHEVASGETANVFFHDVAGWLMMPLALGMLWVELKVLGRLFIDPPVSTVPRPSRERVARRPAAQRTPRPARQPWRPRQPQPAAPGERPTTPVSSGPANRPETK
jgi:exosortase